MTKNRVLKYQVEIQEVLRRTEDVSCYSREEAEKLVRERYQTENIVLDYSDFDSVNFRFLGNEREILYNKLQKITEPYYKSKDFTLLQGDCRILLSQFDFKFDMIFADPPYFLSNDGISCQSGKVVSVNKGEWDKSYGTDYINQFNKEWIMQCRDKLKENGTIWISGTYHNIFSVANQLTNLGFKILNVITWAKTNPPPNISCRYFTYSTEFIIWARKSPKVPHIYNYDLMKKINGGKQMKDVWNMPAIAPWEKVFGKHPTQKPLSLLIRIILSSTNERMWILDPFTGSSTTGIAANLLNRRFLGIDQEKDFLDLSICRKKELDNPIKIDEIREKIKDIAYIEDSSLFVNDENSGYELPFCQ